MAFSLRSSSPPLHERIAERLLNELEESPTKEIPSIVALSKRFRVSYMTMWKAVHVLVEKGIVECRAGAGIARPGTEVRRRARVDPSDRLAEILRSRIVNGLYHTGEALPKINFFAIEEHCASATVLKAIRRLADEGLTHKRGKRWIVGKPVPTRDGLNLHTSPDAPAAVFLVLNAPYWETMFQSSFTSPFVITFLNEMRKHHVGLSMAAIDTPFDEMFALPSGESKVRALVQSLGNRYQGAITSYLSPEISAQWITMLAKFGKPVVAFNHTNEPSLLTRQSLSLRKGDYYHLHLDEEAAVKLALEHLAARGHRIVAAPVRNAPGFEWEALRIAALRKCAARFFPGLHILPFEQAEPWWERFNLKSSIDDLLAVVGIEGDAPVTRMPISARQRAALLERTPSLSSLVRSNKPTALIALNSDMARKYYFWFRLVGIEIPRRLSLISFDDTPESVTFPITTIDFGFARLGYLAAHILIGDIPIKADREGNIPGMCELVDRGSVKTALG